MKRPFLAWDITTNKHSILSLSLLGQACFSSHISSHCNAIASTDFRHRFLPPTFKAGKQESRALPSFLAIHRWLSVLQASASIVLYG